ncbi:MAG: hypothetical protein AB8B56_07080 [Crocinitomicaceae bacterium]
MRNFILLFTFSLILPIAAFSQSKKVKTFTGMLEYKISVRDSALRELVPDNRMIVYTNDTIVRVENFTQNLGTQIAIKHTLLEKSYLMLDTEFGKYAIQMDESESQKSKQANDTLRSEIDKFTFEKKCGRTKMLGYKMKRVMVSHQEFKEPIEFLYLKGYSRKVVDAYPEIEGIPAKYSIITPDAIFDYTLVKISEYTPDNDLFGIPADFERISFDDFMDKLIEAKGAQGTE